ncbi:MAG: hypothetical protein J6X80_01230 [Lachnospiraceae bacterium]|nr:hypothetical protein [Lachnospiraceae bacterium]
MEIKTGHLKCSSCGAPLSLPEGTLKNRIKCSFCGVENFIIDEDVIAGGMNFDLSDADIHRRVLDVISDTKYAPYDIFTESNIKKINKLIVPAYLFVSLTGIGTVTYEKGIDREVSSFSDDGHDDSYTVTDWHAMSAAISDTRDYLVAGNKDFSELFRIMFGENRAPEILKAEQLKFPKDCIEIKFDLTEGDVYGKELKALVDKTIDEKGRASIEDGKTRKVKVDGITIQKGEVRKISVAIYEVILEYKGSEYKILLSNDEKATFAENIPLDSEIQALVEEKKAIYEEADKKAPIGMLVAIIILFIVGFITLFFLIGIVLIIIAIVLLIIYIPKAKESNAKFEEYRKAEGEYLDNFVKAKKDFINKKTALKGVLSNVSGNPDAFPVIVEEEPKEAEEKAEEVKAEEKTENAKAEEKTEETKDEANAEEKAEETK